MTIIDIARFTDRLCATLQAQGLGVSSLKVSPYAGGGVHAEVDGDACLTNIGLWPNGCMDVEYTLVSSEVSSCTHRELTSEEAAFDLFVQEVRNALDRG